MMIGVDIRVWARHRQCSTACQTTTMSTTTDKPCRKRTGLLLQLQPVRSVPGLLWPYPQNENERDILQGMERNTYSVKQPLVCPTCTLSFGGPSSKLHT